MNTSKENNATQNIVVRNLNRVVHAKEFSIFLPLLALCIVTNIINPSFLGFSNAMDVLRSTSFYVIIAVGMTFTIVGGGMDLSVGSTIALCGYVTGMALSAGIPILLSILIGLLLGAFIGLMNGLIIVCFGIPPFITTLGMMYIVKGMVYVLGQGRPIYPLPDSFNKIAQSTLGGVPIPVYIAAVVLLVGSFVLNNTGYGRSVMAIGGNEAAANTSGIDIKKTKVLTYIFTSMLSAVTGILMASRLSSAAAGAGDGWEMIIIAAVIIGGTSLFGGSGSILGTLIGAAIMTVMSNAMVMVKISVYWQNIVVGAIIIAAVIIDTFRRRKTISAKE